MVVYSIHRIIGIRKLASLSDQGRFVIISNYQKHIQVYAFTALFCLGYFSLQLNTLLYPHFLIMGILSIGYTLPLIAGKRLRDFHYVKIFIIAIVWSYVINLPLIIEPLPLWTTGQLLTEKFCFLLAITIPFDIRDRNIDGDLKTLPSLLGIRSAYAFSLILLVVGFYLTLNIRCSMDHGLDGVDQVWLLSNVIGYLCTALLVMLSRNKKSDYYYGGLLDGTLWLKGSLLLMVLLIRS